MIELNIKFLEMYKRIDKICRDMFNCKDGITEYINKMEETPFSNYSKVKYWNEFYKEVKNYRWVRNQLAHDQPLDSNFCEESDMEWLEKFYNDLLNCNDPLTIAYKNGKTIEETKNESNFIEDKYIYEEVKDQSLLKRIINRIKKWLKK